MSHISAAFSIVAEVFSKDDRQAFVDAEISALHIDMSIESTDPVLSLHAVSRGFP